MRTACAIVTAVAVLVMAGCQATSGRGGTAPKEESFRIKVPASIDIDQGETKTFTASVDREDFFKQSVRLVARTSHAGVQITPQETVVESGEGSDVVYRISAAEDAPIGRYKAYIEGMPEIGLPARVDFTVNVSTP